MPFDSSGTFNRVIPGGWKADAQAGIKIRADRHDDEDDGFATGLSTCITKDGRTQPTANIPLNNKKITALGEPTNPSDAATKNYVDTFKAFTTGLDVSGSGPTNGFINFTSPTGVTGVSWTNADMSWVGRDGTASQSRKRLAVNDGVDGLGTDVCTVDEGGFINNSGYLSNNLSFDGAWRTIAPGHFTTINYLNSAVAFSSNDVASTTAYQSITPRMFFYAANSGGNSAVNLYKSATGKEVTLTSYTGASAPRWQIVMGNATAESGGNAGSDFGIMSYGDGGASAFEVFINRATHEFTTGGNLTSNGRITSAAGYFQSSVTGAILSCNNGGSIRFRPWGADNGTREVYIDDTGSVVLTYGGVKSGAGYYGKYGASGGYDGQWHNLFYQGGFEYVLVGDTLMGAITWQSDYRIKRNIRPLDSMWEKVKSLNPIKYNHAKFREFVEDDDVERWGMLAHELQEKLVDSAAFGHKDEDNVIQSVNPLTVIAALTKGLQEAMLRIEDMETLIKGLREARA